MIEPLPTLANARYAIAKKLGEGGQAATFEAVDKRQGALVVLKRFRVRGATSWKEVELAEREAKVLASLDHPSVPSYVEHFEENGELWLVTKKIEGESLAEKRARGGAFSTAQVIRFLADARGALEYLHGRSPPVIHRDIKPSNVIVRPDGSFALIDFGSVRDRLKPQGGSTVVGTFGFMAPEQFQGRAMPASDVYAVGVTALVLLTGIDPEDLPHRGLAIDVAAALRRSTVPRELTRALEKMLDPDPDQRAKRVPVVAGADEPTGGGKRDRSPREAPDLVDAWKRDRDRRRDEGKRGREEASPWRELREGARVIRDELERERERMREAGAQARDAFREEVERARGGPASTKKQRRRAERDERRESKREERRARRSWAFGKDPLVYVDQWQRARRRHEAFPRALLGFVLLGLWIGSLAVGLTIQVLVPGLLVVLSLVFGRALRQAAGDVRKAGTKARRAIALTRRVVLQRDAEEYGTAPRADKARVAVDEPRVRVAPPGVRVVSDEDAEIEAEAAREAEEAAHGRRRR